MTLKAITTLGQNGPGSNGNQVLLHIPELEPNHQM